jgi:hypothetical protein
MGGTSSSTPLVAGAAAIVRQYFTDIEGFAAPSSALIKGTLINGAVDMSGEYGYPNGAAEPIPNEHEGWGRVDLMNSLFPPSPYELDFIDIDENNGLHPVNNPDDVYYYEVNGDPTLPIKISLVWTDREGAPHSGGLVNDLDLEVESPDGKIYKGNNFVNGWSQDDPLYHDGFNNVENVYIQSTAQCGMYRIKVSLETIGTDTAPYSLVVRYPKTVIEPPENFRISIDSNEDAILTWNSVPNAIGYHIYRSVSGLIPNVKTGFDFAAPPWQSVSGATLTITDSDADLYEQAYYAMRTEGPYGLGPTSYTIGKWTRQLQAGINTVSLPLEPFSLKKLSDYYGLLPLNSISWLDDNDDWRTYPPDDKTEEIGEGYVWDLMTPASFTFVGWPGTHVRIGGVCPGALAQPSNFDITVSGPDIVLSWDSVGADEYIILRSSTRVGFDFNTIHGTTVFSSWTDSGVNDGNPNNKQYYYMVRPVNSVSGYDVVGESTYSLGKWTAIYDGNDFFGLPALEHEETGVPGPPTTNLASWYVTNPSPPYDPCIDVYPRISHSLGMAYWDNGWKAHFCEFPPGVYDSEVIAGYGFELTVYDQSIYTFEGL